MASIGKNTVYLYIRSFFILVISLYTSRVILDKLGVEDFGLYNTIGSVTASLSFLSGALGLATSRFLTYNLGTGDMEKQKNVFGNIISIYAILSIIIVVGLEAVGPWFINNKLVILEGRYVAANWVFHISILTVVFSMLSTPFTSLIIAHEDMNVFAIIGVFDAVAKLGICYLITITSYDRLIIYAVLLLLEQIILWVYNFIYTKRHYLETELRFHFEKDTLLSIGSFAGWSLIGQFSRVLKMQGVNIITNMFFGSAVVAARAISSQVDRAVNTFVGNFMTAVNPQVLKRHAAGNDDSSNDLVQKSTIFAFVLATIICFPVALNADFILHIWLKEVPTYAVPFVQIIMIQSAFSTIENGLYSIFFSRGRVKENSLVTPVLGIFMFVVVYILFKLGYSPMALSYVYLLQLLLSCLVIKPILIHKIFGLEKVFFWRMDYPCFLLLLSTIPLLLIHYLAISDYSWFSFLWETLLSTVYICLISFFFIIDKGVKQHIVDIIKSYKDRYFHKQTTSN